MRYVRFIFEGKVLNYQNSNILLVLIYRKIIESSLKDLNCIWITKLVQKQEKNRMDENLFSLPIAKVFLYIV